MNDGFSSDFSDIDKMIKQLDLMSENVNKGVREALSESADSIMKEQKRLIEGTSKLLAKAISKSRVYADKHNVLGVTTGYQANAFKAGEDGKTSPGLVGMIFEYGRPGQKGNTTMKQKRGDKEVEVTIGLIDPVPHIRRGFDNKSGEAVEHLASRLQQELDKTFDE